MKLVPHTGPEAQHRLLLAQSLNEIVKRLGTGEVTLTAGATSTVITDNLLQSSSALVLMPTTANAAAALTTTYLSARANGQFTLTHANNAQVDRTFVYIRA